LWYVKRDEDLIQHEHDKEMDKQLDTAGGNNTLFRGEEALHYLSMTEE